MQYDFPVPNEVYDAVRVILFGMDDKSILDVKKHKRNTWIIHYIFSGHGYFEINGKNYRIGPGDIFVIPADVTISYGSDTNDAFDYVWICFKAGKKLPLEIPDVLHCPEAYENFMEMKKCINMKKGRGAFLNARLWDLFAMIMQKEDDGKDEITKAIEYIHSNYAKDLTIDKLAENSGIERTYFSTLFKKKTGMSPKQYLTDYRMKTAASLIVDLKKGVSEAAHAVGYTDVFNFSKMFKKRYGMSPREYVKTRNDDKHKKGC